MKRLHSGTYLALMLAWAVAPASARQTDSTAVHEVEFQADSLITRVVDGVEINELVNPRIRTGTTFVRALRGVRQGSDEFLFYQRVTIIDEADTVTADRVLYHRVTKIGRATGSVRLGDGEVVVTAPEGDYDARAKRADFRAGVTLVDSASVLTSRAGSYWTEDKRAEFSGAVQLAGDSLDVHADSVVYLRETRESTAWGRVLVVQTEQEGHSWLLGERAVNDERSGRSRVDGDVYLFRVQRDSTGAEPDTLMLRAGRVWSQRTDSLDRFSAVDSVRMWRREFAALSDSLAFDRAESSDSSATSRLFGRPVAWFRGTQISGDTLSVRGRGERLDSLRVTGSAFVAREDTVSGRLQQLRGARLLGLFDGDSLRTMQIEGQAEALYWLEPTDGTDGGGVKVSADRIRFGFAGDDVSDLRVYEGVEGTWYPANLIDQAGDLPGLEWRPTHRPDASYFRVRLEEARCRIDACGDDLPDLPPDP